MLKHVVNRGLKLLLLTGVLSACSHHPDFKPMPVIDQFELSKYLGTWYEIARLDNSFEEGLGQGVAQYSMREDGRVKVINQGWHLEDQQWNVAEGVARFADEKKRNLGHLEVSFFWIFYGDYRIFYLEPDYSVALVGSDTPKYFWLLARQKTLPQEKLKHYLSLAKQAGIDTDKVILPTVVTQPLPGGS